MDNGVLTITVPKEESEEPEKKYIEIKQDYVLLFIYIKDKLKFIDQFEF